MQKGRFALRQWLVHCAVVSVQEGHGFVGVGVEVGAGVGVGVGRLVGGEVAPGVTGGRLSAAVGVAVGPGDPEVSGAGVIEPWCPPTITCAGGRIPNPPWGSSGPSPPRIPPTATTPMAPMVATPVP